MEGTPRKTRTYYRCATRSMVPGSPALHGHPKNVYLPEAAVLEPLNAWIGRLFTPANLDRTVAALVASPGGPGGPSRAREAAEHRRAKAEARLQGVRAAIEAGVQPNALVESINDAQQQRAAAKAELENTPALNVLDTAEVYALIDSLGDVGRELNRADPAKLEDIYEKLRLPKGL